MPPCTSDSIDTRILSRSAFARHVDAHLDALAEAGFVVALMSINNLGRYNRIYGIEAGDEVLHDAMQLVDHMVPDTWFARYAGDSFLFVAPVTEVVAIVEAVSQLLADTDDRSLLEVKCGVVACQVDTDADGCIERASFTADSIRHRHDISFRFFDRDLNLAFEKHTYVVDHLDEAIARGEIEAWSQPIIRILTGKICEVEALARWKSERFGYLRPDEFVPDLERHQLIHKLDLEVIRLACAQWIEATRMGAYVPFGVNLSRLDFELCDVCTEICTITERYGVPVDQVHIEITESSLAQDRELVSAGIERFLAAGFHVYMDDFGTGYSSLGSMADLHFNVIKLDKELLDHVEDDERSRVVLADTVAMVKRLGMQTLCEGVETPDQLDFLRAIGCEKAQGYLFAKPLPHDQIMQILARQTYVHEDQRDIDYLDAVGQINLLDGTSASLHGIEAATFSGRLPIAVLEFCGESIRMLTGNFAYVSLLHEMGFSTFSEFCDRTKEDSGQIHARMMQAAEEARRSGSEQSFDFIIGNTFCSASLRFVAHSRDGRDAFLNTVKSVENAPQVTEHVLLQGILETGNRNFFWKDTRRRFIGANQQFLDYYGFDGLEAILGKTDEDMGWHVDNNPFRNDELRVLRGESIVNAHGVCSCQGEFRNILATKRPLRSNGAIVGLVGYFEDMGLHAAGDGWID